MRVPVRSVASTLLVSYLLGAPALAQGGFVDRTAEVGLQFRTLSGLDTFETSVGIIRDWLQSGLSLGDLDNDGDLDVVLCGGVRPNAVFRNDGGTFTDVSSIAKLEAREADRVAAFGDYDGDGDQDIFIGAAHGNSYGVIPGRSRIYRNEGNFVFEELTDLTGIVGNGQSVFAQWTDLDLDGLLDLYVGEFYSTANLWYRNNGDGTFSELAGARGLDNVGNAHVVTTADTDLDGLPDVQIGNDYLVAAALQVQPSINPGNRFLHNSGDGTFADISQIVNMAFTKGVMGVTFGDVNYDGLIDMYQANIQQNILTINQGAPGSMLIWLSGQGAFGVANELLPFPDDPEEFGVSVGWGTFFLNANLDRWLDLYVANGHVAGLSSTQTPIPREQQNVLYIGDGPTNSFHYTDRTEEYGLFERIDDRGAALGDIDGDGDQDFLVMATSGAVRYKENQVERNGQGWLKVTAETHTSAPGGIGTTVRMTDSDGIVHMRLIGLDAPTASQNEIIAYYGLGLDPDADVEVTFTSGIVQSYVDVPANSHLVAVEPQLFDLSTRKLFRPSLGIGNDSLTVTVFAHAADGSPLDASAAVEIDVPGLAPTTPVQSVGGNVFERTFASSETAGEYPVEVSFDGWSPLIRPRVHVVGTLSLARSTVRCVPEAIRGDDSGDEVTVTVVPRDTEGLAIGSGLAVSISLDPALPVLEGVTDLGDGRYRARFGSPPAGSGVAAKVRVGVGGSLLASAPLIDVGGAASPGQTIVRLEQPHPPQGSSPNQIKVLLTPRDSAGRRLGPDANITMRVTSQTAPTIPASTGRASASIADRVLSAVPDVAKPGALHPGTQARVLDDLGQGGQRDGDFVFVIEKPESMSDVLLSGTAEVLEDGVPFLTIPWTFEPQSTFGN